MSAAPNSPTDTPAESGPDIDGLADAHRLATDVRAAVSTVIDGKEDVVLTASVVLLAAGHLLLEDVPGVGKTTLAKALARVIDSPMRRIQFTPDLLPSDITGVNVFDQQRRAFEFRPGAIFANVVVCDEINRASPKTQSAVLESMEEGQVTVDGRTYPLGEPFLVVATQNPLEMEGTYPLPEAQRDRFMARVSVGYPSPDAELAMLEHHGDHDPLGDLTPITDAASVVAATHAVRTVHASPALRRYLVDLVDATRSCADLRLGASPRASLHLLRATRARAAILGRDHVLPDDVTALADPVLTHRLHVSRQARLSGLGAADVIRRIVETTPVPAAPVGRASSRRR